MVQQQLTQFESKLNGIKKNGHLVGDLMGVVDEVANEF